MHLSHTECKIEELEVGGIRGRGGKGKGHNNQQAALKQYPVEVSNFIR